MELNGKRLKSIFIGLLVSKRHEKFIEEYLEMCKNFTYPSLSLNIIENTPHDRKYFQKLKKLCSKYDFIDNLIRYEWKPKEKLCFEMIADCKNILREKFLDGNYDLYFSLDADTTIPPNSIEYLVEDNKDNVGFPTPITNFEPCVLKQGGGVRKNIIIRDINGSTRLRDNGEPLTKSIWTLDLYSWYELIAMTKDDNSYLQRVYAVCNGCLMSKRKVIKKVKWEVPRNFAIGEDIIWYENVNQKGFEFWVDMRTIPIHRPVGWKMIPTWIKSQNQKIYTIFGNLPDEIFEMNPSELKKLIKSSIRA